MRIQEGLVGIADTRITTGSECITAKKVSIHKHGNYQLFLMTSGLRSVRDKALTYFEEVLEDKKKSYDKLYKIVNEFGKQLRRVAQEDRASLKESGLDFNVHAIIGGQLSHDRDHKLYLLYPEGNWVEINQGTPYQIIGSARYGKPILDRALRYDCTLDVALKVGYLAFDATFMSATDVAFPIDVVIYRPNSYDIIEQRFEKEEFTAAAAWWQQHIVKAIGQLSIPDLDDFYLRAQAQPLRRKHDSTLNGKHTVKHTVKHTISSKRLTTRVKSKKANKSDKNDRND
jgi:putative proteasome-type protease